MNPLARHRRLPPPVKPEDRPDQQLSRYGEEYLPIDLNGTELYLAMWAIESSDDNLDAVDTEEYERFKGDLSKLRRRLIDHWGHRLTGPGEGCLTGKTWSPPEGSGDQLICDLLKALVGRDRDVVVEKAESLAEWIKDGGVIPFVNPTGREGRYHTFEVRTDPL